MTRAFLLVASATLAGCVSAQPSRFTASDGPLAQSGLLGAMLTHGNPTQREMGLDPVQYRFPGRTTVMPPMQCGYGRLC